MTFDELSDNVLVWAEEKGILVKDNAPKQMLKVLEEVGETAGALLKGNETEIKDGIGDSFVTLIILSKQLGLSPTECLEAAWNEIKDRTGKTVDGVFVKNEN
jgi:NTP pyrophosphatase (non-canonical NTP hydrolase)